MLRKAGFPTNLTETASELPFLLLMSSFAPSAFYIAPQIFILIKHKAVFVTHLLQNDGTHCWQNKPHMISTPQLTVLAFIWIRPKAWYFHPPVLLRWYEPDLHTAPLSLFASWSPPGLNATYSSFPTISPIQHKRPEDQCCFQHPIWTNISPHSKCSLNICWKEGGKKEGKSRRKVGRMNTIRHFKEKSVTHSNTIVYETGKREESPFLCIHRCRGKLKDEKT